MISYVLCPECGARIDLDAQASSVLEGQNGREVELECDHGHSCTMHHAVMATRCQPNHYSVYADISGIETGKLAMRVGEWRVIPLRTEFEEIDAVETICTPLDRDHGLPNSRAEGLFDSSHPDHFWLMTGGSEDECGLEVRIDWTAYGIQPRTSMEVWRENLVFAARQLLCANYRPSVLQSAVAVESFVHNHVHQFLQKQACWKQETIDAYIDSHSRDSLPLQGLIKVCIQELMRVELPRQLISRWGRLREMRNALAHGDLSKYMRLADLEGRRFSSERSRAEFAYRTAVQFIYETRYPSIRKRV